MPYRKNFKRRGGHRPRWYNSKAARHIAKGGMSIAKMAAAAYFTSKALKKSNNIEYKIHELTNNASYDYNGTVSSLLSGLSQGTQDTQRIGDSMKNQNLTFRFYTSRNTADSIVRIMVIRDDQNKISAVTDVLQASGSAFSVLSPKNYDKRFQSKILYDRTFVLDVDQTTIKREMVIPLGFHSQFQSGGTTINTGDIKLLIVSNLVTSNLPSVAWYSRVTFTDN